MGKLNEAKERDSAFKPVLFIDNVETITNDAILEEIRMLLDLTVGDGKPLLTIVLSGDPRAREVMRRHASLVQRIEVGYELAPLGEEDARNYILHRIRVAGGPKRIFDNAALRGAFKASSGLPRLLNRQLAEGRHDVEDLVETRPLEAPAGRA